MEVIRLQRDLPICGLCISGIQLMHVQNYLFVLIFYQKDLEGCGCRSANKTQEIGLVPFVQILY